MRVWSTAVYTIKTAISELRRGRHVVTWSVCVCVAGIRSVRRLNPLHKELNDVHVARSNARLRQRFYRLLNVQGTSDCTSTVSFWAAHSTISSAWFSNPVYSPHDDFSRICRVVVACSGPGTKSSRGRRTPYNFFYTGFFTP